MCGEREREREREKEKERQRDGEVDLLNHICYAQARIARMFVCMYACIMHVLVRMYLRASGLHVCFCPCECMKLAFLSPSGPLPPSPTPHPRTSPLTLLHVIFSLSSDKIDADCNSPMQSDVSSSLQLFKLVKQAAGLSISGERG